MGDTNATKVASLKDQGNAALNSGNLQEAIKFYSQAIELDSSNHVLFSNRSAAYAKAHKYKEALDDAEKCIRLKPDWAKGYSRKGAALAYLQRHSEALDAYNEGLKYDPNNQQLKDAILEVELQTKGAHFGNLTSPLFGDPNILVKLAADPRTREYLKDPKYMEWLNEMKNNNNPHNLDMTDPRVLNTLSVILGVPFNIATNDTEMEPDNKPSYRPSPPPTKQQPKEEKMEEDLTEERKQALAEKEKGNAAYKNKDFEVALQHYGKAIELDPSDMTFRSNRAAVYFEQKEYEACIKECEEAIEVGRENRADFKIIAKAYARMASAYIKLNDLYKARTYLQKSLTEHRTQENVKKLQELEKKIKEEEKKAYIDPEKSLEEKNKGNECFQKGDYPKAVKHYTEAILRNPDDAKLYSNRAACYQKLAEFDLALKDAEQCVKLDPEFVKGHVRKGLALMAKKEHSRAQSAFQKALELDPNCQEALDCYRKCVTATSGNPEEIRKQAMSDPEVQQILADPAMRLIIEQMQNDPKALQEHLKNPHVASKIHKLIESGLIAIRY